MPDLTCARCGRTMASSPSSLPQGQATCRPCRRIEAGPYRTREIKSYGDAECPICHAIFDKSQPRQTYCSPSCRESRRNWSYATKAASAEERGYGKAHREERARWKPLVESGQTTCCICGQWIEPGTEWHLDHTEDRSGYRGAAHSVCNLRDGARRGARRTNASRSIEKVCEQCQRPFLTAYPKQRYCSRECRPKREAKPALCKVRFVECPTCGVLFTSRFGRKYCADHRGYQLALPTSVLCVVCGHATESLNGPTKKYCSTECAHSTPKYREKKRLARRRYKDRKREGLGRISTAA